LLVFGYEFLRTIDHLLWFPRGLAPVIVLPLHEVLGDPTLIALVDDALNLVRIIQFRILLRHNIRVTGHQPPLKPSFIFIPVICIWCISLLQDACDCICTTSERRTVRETLFTILQIAGYDRLACAQYEHRRAVLDRIMTKVNTWFHLGRDAPRCSFGRCTNASHPNIPQ